MLIPVWFTMLVAGVVVMMLMVVTPPKVDAILSRLSAACFMSSGNHLATGSGWIAVHLRGISAWLTEAIDGNIAAMIGATVITGLIAGAWGLFWVLAMLPDKWVGTRYDDRMIYSGWPLPFFIGIIPGGLGAALITITTGISDLTTSLVTSVVR